MRRKGSCAIYICIERERERERGKRVVLEGFFYGWKNRNGVRMVSFKRLFGTEASSVVNWLIGNFLSFFFF